MADSPVAAYQVKQSNGAFKVVRRVVRDGALRHRDPEGRAGWPTRSSPALEKLIADGRYKEILKKWGVAEGAITNPEINGATS